MLHALMTKEQAAEHRFAVFQEPKWGFRALAVVLRNYQRLHNIQNVAAMIARFAPAGENDTEAYIAHVADMLGVAADRPIDLGDEMVLSALCRAIAIHESGGWVFSDDDLMTGVRMALAAADGSFRAQV